MNNKSKKLDFLGEIEKPDFTLKADDIDPNNPEQVAALEKQKIHNANVFLKQSLRRQYDKGIIDENGNSLIQGDEK